MLATASPQAMARVASGSVLPPVGGGADALPDLRGGYPVLGPHFNDFRREEPSRNDEVDESDIRGRAVDVEGSGCPDVLKPGRQDMAFQLLPDLRVAVVGLEKVLEHTP